MTTTQMLITVFIAGAATVLTRAIAFIAFPPGRETPRYISYLGHALPGAVFGLLVVYCLKDVDVTAGTHGVPEALGILATAAVYLWRRDMLWAILAGTLSYMALVNLVF